MSDYETILAALKAYHTQYTVDDDHGEGLPLVDVLTPLDSGSIEPGLREMELLADAIDAALSAVKEKGE